jgi:hypothetical protein
MPRIISFALTTDQFRDRSKTVTRRLGWRSLRAGTPLTTVVQSQGLKKGQKVTRLGLIRVIDVRREPLNRMCLDLEYGREECTREGFPELSPAGFVSAFCLGHNCKPDAMITRIEYGYVE